jgi:hypothetical protein
MAIVSVPDFLPSKSGLQFGNDFPKVPVRSITVPHFGDVGIGDASGGLCGGMAYTVADLFEEGVAPPDDDEPPAPRSKLFNYLVDRLIDSFDVPWGVARYFEWMQLPDEDHFFFRGAPRRVLQEEWPVIRERIDNGHPCPLGLVTVRSLNPMDLKFNHQVTAYAYEIDGDSGDVTLWVYDPNQPGDDNVFLTLAPGDAKTQPSISYSGGMTVRAFFRTSYTPNAGVRAIAKR